MCVEQNKRDSRATEISFFLHMIFPFVNFWFVRIDLEKEEKNNGIQNLLWNMTHGVISVEVNKTVSNKCC